LIEPIGHWYIPQVAKALEEKGANAAGEFKYCGPEREKKFEKFAS